MKYYTIKSLFLRVLLTRATSKAKFSLQITNKKDQSPPRTDNDGAQIEFSKDGNEIGDFLGWMCCPFRDNYSTQ